MSSMLNVAKTGRSKDPLVSVITITRNNLQELKATVQSVLSQSYAELEILVIDGLSTDGTVEYLKTLNGPRLSWISEADSGIADAFNKGQDFARGDIALFLNSGDEFSSADTVAHAMGRIPDGVDIRQSIIYGNFYAIRASGVKLVHADHNRLSRTNSINHQSVFVGMDVCRRFRYDGRLILGMDYDYWLRCRSAGVPFVKIDLPIARFRCNGRSSRSDLRAHNESIRFFLRALNERRVIGVADMVKLCLRAFKTDLSGRLRRAYGDQTIDNCRHAFGLRDD